MIETTIYLELLPDDSGDVSWLEQTPAQLGSLEAAVANRRRLEAYRRGDWSLVGVRLACELGEGCTFTSPGLWGIESDSGEEYLRSCLAERDDWTYLAAELAEFGIHPDRPDYAALEIREGQ